MAKNKQKQSIGARTATSEEKSPPSSAKSVATFDDSDGPLIALSELARHVGVSLSTINRWAFDREPTLRVVKRFGVWRTKIKWYHDWLAAQN